MIPTNQKIVMVVMVWSKEIEENCWGKETSQTGQKEIKGKNRKRSPHTMAGEIG